MHVRLSFLLFPGVFVVFFFSKTSSSAIHGHFLSLCKMGLRRKGKTSVNQCSQKCDLWTGPQTVTDP